ncbi:MAG: hypothetical protein IT377_15035 [Polyangiaceae bacterium]|nr:hypothetical protein [Polyangiaceae bacterium]
MSGWLVGVAMLGAGFALAAMLVAARKLADWLGSDEPPAWRGALFAIVALAAVAGLHFLPHGGLLALLTLWVLIGAALEQRGGAARGRLAVLQLYLVLFASAYTYGNALGLWAGGGASVGLRFALVDQLTQIALPLADRVLAFSRAASPQVATHAVADGLARHLVLWVAVAAFALAVYSSAYFARRPLALPGAALLPWPRVVALAFLVLAVAGRFVPSRFAPLPAIVLCPLFMTDGAALVHRWSSRLRARGLLLVVLSAALPLVPALAFIAAALGAVSQLLGLRELLPFAALDEAPLRRPRLGAWLVFVVVSSLVVVAGASAAHRGLRRASPLLGAPADICGGGEPSVDWDARTATFDLPRGRVTMDLDETPLDAASPAGACERAGKRLCTSDEWYLACACTYPLELEPGTKTSTLYAFVARADRERRAGAPEPRQPTLASDKRSELRGLLTGKSEVVSQGAGRAVLLAGPADALRDPWTVDCRHRSFTTERALPSQLIAARCCR